MATSHLHGEGVVVASHPSDHLHGYRSRKRDESPDPAYLASMSRLTPPSTPRDIETASISSRSSTPSLAARPSKAHYRAFSPDAAANIRSAHNSQEISNEGTATLSPTNSSPIPPPYLPLRKKSSQRLRQALGAPPPSPLRESSPHSSIRVASPTPSLSDTHSVNGYQQTRGDSHLRNAYPSPTSIAASDSSRDDVLTRPIIPSSLRSRGQTASTQSAPQSTHQVRRPIRLSTSIPDLNRHNRHGPSTYRPNRGPPVLEAEPWPYMRREPLSRQGYTDEARSSFRSGWTNASSGFYDVSGTERSSVVTKTSSISEFPPDVRPEDFEKLNGEDENNNGVDGEVEAEPDHEAAVDGDLDEDDDDDDDDEGMSVEDAIKMYEGGFIDETEIDPLDVSDEGYHSQVPLSSSEQINGPAAGHRRSSTGMFGKWSTDGLQQPSDHRASRSLRHSKSSAQMTSGRGRSLAVEPVPTHSAPVPRDRYGFKKATHHITVEQYNAWDKNYTVYLERRKEKWMRLMKSHGLSTERPDKFPPRSDKVKRYIRKGIPYEWRGAAWFWYSGGATKLEENPGLYWNLIEQVSDGKLSLTDKETIERDLNRTFPDNIRFKPDRTSSMDSALNQIGKNASAETYNALETPIMRSLRRVLQAFAVHNPNIGYCQSLNFIAGLLLLFLDEDEEKVFFMLEIITTVHLPGTHGKILEANIDIGVLMSCIQEAMPPIWARINDLEDGTQRPGAPVSVRLPTVSLATTSWFMSLFVANLPVETVLRVWDAFFYEGSKTLFRIALAIFKVGEAEIRGINDPMEIFQVVQTIPRKQLDPNQLMEACFRRRNGFGHLSQETIDARRAERRRLHAADIARINGAEFVPEEVRKRPSGLRRAASKMSRNRKRSKV